MAQTLTRPENEGETTVEVLPAIDEPQVPEDENFKFNTMMGNRGKTVKLIIKFDMKDKEMAEQLVKNYGEFIVDLIGQCFAKSMMSAGQPAKDASFYG